MADLEYLEKLLILVEKSLSEDGTNCEQNSKCSSVRGEPEGGIERERGVNSTQCTTRDESGSGVQKGQRAELEAAIRAWCSSLADRLCSTVTMHVCQQGACDEGRGHERLGAEQQLCSSTSECSVQAHRRSNDEEGRGHMREGAERQECSSECPTHVHQIEGDERRGQDREGAEQGYCSSASEYLKNLHQRKGEGTSEGWRGKTERRLRGRDRFSWNARLTLLHNDLNAVRQLLIPDNQVCGCESVSGGNTHNRPSGGGEVDEGQQSQRGITRVASPSDTASSRRALERPGRGDERDAEAMGYSLRESRAFTRLPTMDLRWDGDVSDPKPTRVDPREVLRRSFCQETGAAVSKRRLVRPIRQVVSKQPQLATISEERDLSEPVMDPASQLTKGSVLEGSECEGLGGGADRECGERQAGSTNQEHLKWTVASNQIKELQQLWPAVANQSRDHHQPSSLTTSQIRDQRQAISATANQIADHSSPLASTTNQIRDQQEAISGTSNEIRDHQQPISNQMPEIQQHSSATTNQLREFLQTNFQTAKMCREFQPSRTGPSTPVQDPIRQPNSSAANQVRDHQHPTAAVANQLRDLLMASSAVANHVEDLQHPTATKANPMQDVTVSGYVSANQVRDHRPLAARQTNQAQDQAQPANRVQQTRVTALKETSSPASGVSMTAEYLEVLTATAHTCSGVWRTLSKTTHEDQHTGGSQQSKVISESAVNPSAETNDHEAMPALAACGDRQQTGDGSTSDEAARVHHSSKTSQLCEEEKNVETGLQAYLEGVADLPTVPSSWDKLTSDKELLALLWMCRMVEGVERRAQEVTNRMRHSVTVGRATLEKLTRLQKVLATSCQ